MLIVKILFIARATLFTNRGGDTIQILNTARYLQQINVLVDIRLCNETIAYQQYDLIHFFNIIRPADIMLHIKRSNKPYVVSTIYVDYSEFEKKARKNLAGKFLRLLPKNFFEYAKIIARSIINREKIGSIEYLWKGHTKSVIMVIKNAALLLPNSFNEYKRLSTDYKINQNYRVIPNAIDEDLFAGLNILDKNNSLVLCVGRVEELKNQLNLIKALNNSQFQLLIIGSAGTNHKRYYKTCIKEAAKNIRFIEYVPQHELIKYYCRANVHVLPSWFETTGLSSLEAAAMGCNIVITDKGDTREYFEDMAFYCNPESLISIRQAIEQAAMATPNVELQKKILANYTWRQTAIKTKEAYQLVLATKYTMD